MKKPKRPNRKPDAVIEAYSFWFAEGVWAINTSGDGDYGNFYYRMDFEKWKYYSYYFENWISLDIEGYNDKIKDAYANWLLEKEILGEVE